MSLSAEERSKREQTDRQTHHIHYTVRDTYLFETYVA